jgi:hypothetical protein
MDQNRLKQLCLSALGVSYPKVEICDFVVVPTFKYDDTQNDWTPDSYSLFVQVKKGSVILNRPGEMESFLESLLGFECCVDFV